MPQEAQQFNLSPSALSSISESVHQVFLQEGLVKNPAECRTVCRTSVTIGSDGRPVPTVSCELICDL